MKPLFQKEQQGTHKCTGCKRKCSGTYLRYTKKLTPAVDGGMASRIYFACTEKNHLCLVGYDKLVDFNLESSPYDLIDNKSFEEEEEELEAGWKELEENARKRRRLFAGSI